MSIKVNGKDMPVADGTTILALLTEKGLDPETVVVEKNGDIIPGESFGAITLISGDELEILSFVGGG